MNQFDRRVNDLIMEVLRESGPLTAFGINQRLTKYRRFLNNHSIGQRCRQLFLKGYLVRVRDTLNYNRFLWDVIM